MCIRDRHRFSRRALVTTQKLDRLIAAAPNIGLSFHPNKGYHKPAAIEMYFMAADKEIKKGDRKSVV